MSEVHSLPQGAVMCKRGEVLVRKDKALIRPPEQRQRVQITFLKPERQAAGLKKKS